MIALDTETTLITPEEPIPRLVCVQLHEEGESDIFHARDGRDTYDALIGVLAECYENYQPMVGANIAFDFAVLLRQWPEFSPLVFGLYERGLVSDVLIRQKLLDIATGVYRVASRVYSLDELTQRWLGLQLDKGSDSWRLRYEELIDTPLPEWPSEATEYALADVAATAGVWELQNTHAHLLADEARQCRAAWFLHMMSCHGVITDPVRVAAFRESVARHVAELRADLVSVDLVDPKTGSRRVKVAQEYLTELAALEGFPLVLTDSGKPATDRETLLATGDHWLEKFAEYTHLTKQGGTDVPALEAGSKGFAIHPRFEVLLETGRTSCSKPNLQNPPRKGPFRECIVPRPGHVFIDSDYGKLELFTWATVCQQLLGVSRMAQVLAKGEDPHLSVAAEIAQIDLADAKARHAEGDPEFSNTRNCAKVANFGFPGGLGPPTFVKYAASSYGIRMTEDFAAHLREIWRKTWPEARLYHEFIGSLQESSTRPDGSITLQHLVSERYRGKCSFTSACNSYFQGMGADIAKHAGWLLTRACYDDIDSPLYGCRVVNFIHDQFLTEAPEDRAREAAIEQTRLMRVAAVPFLLPSLTIDVDTKLATCWSKDARRLVDEEGRLIPWQPTKS